MTVLLRKCLLYMEVYPRASLNPFPLGRRISCDKVYDQRKTYKTRKVIRYHEMGV